MKNKEVYKKALKIYGKSMQCLMLFEEMAELQKEVCKSLRNKKNNIVEELADVYIMLEQIKLIFHISDNSVLDIKKYKIERLKNLLDKE